MDSNEEKPKSDHERLLEARKKQAAEDAAKNDERIQKATKPTEGNPRRKPPESE